MHEGRHHALTKDLEIHFVELPKWHYKTGAKMNRLERWLAYLSPETTDEEKKRLAMKDPTIGLVIESEKVFQAAKSKAGTKRLSLRFVPAL